MIMFMIPLDKRRAEVSKKQELVIFHESQQLWQHYYSSAYIGAANSNYTVYCHSVIASPYLRPD